MLSFPIFFSSKRHSTLYMFVYSNNALPAISDMWQRLWNLRFTTQLRFSSSKLTKLGAVAKVPG